VSGKGGQTERPMPGARGGRYTEVTAIDMTATVYSSTVFSSLGLQQCISCLLRQGTGEQLIGRSGGGELRKSPKERGEKEEGRGMKRPKGVCRWDGRSWWVQCER
jgi:hypothetical protein